MTYDYLHYSKLPAQFGGAFEIEYKGVMATAAMGDDWLSIYTIESSNQGEGEVQEFVQLLIKDHPGMRICSSISLNPAWTYICQKYNIETGANL
jgi:hypothetical protein